MTMLGAVRLREWPATLAALAVMTVVEIGLRTTTLPRLSRWMGVPLAVNGTAGNPAPGARLVLSHRTRVRLRAARKVARHWPFGDTCLRRALVSGQRLRRLGPELHVGVALVDGAVAAHAWLEIDGFSLDPTSKSFAPLHGVPPGGADE